MSGNKDDVTSLAELKQALAKFLKERDWEKFHQPKNISMSIAIEAAEMMEHFQWLTTNECEDKNPPNLAQINEELADIILYSLSLARYYDIDITTSILNKLELNRKKYPAKEYHGRF